MQERDRPENANEPPNPPEYPVDSEAFQNEEPVPDVADDEIIDRSINLIPQYFRKGQNGEIKVSASAFNDRDYEPSFYREHLCENPPHTTPPRMKPDDAVAYVAVANIRGQESIPFKSGNAPSQSPPTSHSINVKAVPEGHHKSHAVVYTSPEFGSDGGFKRLKELLAQLVSSNWAIPPSDDFLEANLKNFPPR